MRSESDYEDAKRAIAAIYRSEGGAALTADEFIRASSYDRNWFTPSQARDFTVAAEAAGLLKREGRGLAPAFDIAAVPVQVDFRPKPLQMPAQEGRDLFSAIVDEIQRATGLERRRVVAGINGRQERLPAAVEVLALLHGADLGVDISHFFPLVEAAIRRRS